MDIKNLERAVEIKHELFKINDALKNLNGFPTEPGKVGFLISEHIDRSGNHVDFQYKNGDYHPVYAEILKFAKQKFQEVKDDIEKEIKTL